MLRIATIGTSMITDDFIQVVNANDQAAFVGTLSRDAERGAAFTAEHGGERNFTALDELASADDVDAVVTRNGAEMGWDVPPVITYVSRQAELAPNEACKTFNMGVGMVLTVAPEDADKAIAILKAHGEDAYRLGTIVEGDGVELV